MMRHPTGTRTRAALTAILLTLGCFTLTSVNPTEAAWTNDQYATGSYAAKVVAPPSAPVCFGDGLLSSPGVSFTAPVGGQPPGGYVWTLTQTAGIGVGAVTAGTLAASATRWAEGGGLLNVIGTWRLTIRAADAAPSGWVSAPIQATVGRTTLVFIPLIGTCSVP